VLTAERGAVPRLRWLRWIRYRELVLLQATPLFGVLFAAGPRLWDALPRVGLFAAGGFLLLAHTFTFNDWAEFGADLKDPDKAAALTRRDATRSELGALSLGLLLLALVVFGLLGTRTLLLGAALAALGTVYSHPAIHGKAVPVLSSTLHLVAGILHFLLGYSLEGPIDLRGVLIGLFFALTFTAGHLNQELRDYEGDRLNGLRTNAVTFGRTTTFLAGLALFTLAYAHLVALALAGLVPPALGWLGALYPIHLGLSVVTLRGGLTYESMTRFRDRYRALYALLGLGMLGGLLLA
jgi:4-hydroxybenzoate polyprenyltransferase